MAKSQIVVTGSTYGLPPELRPGASKPLAGEKATRPLVPVGWVRLQPDDHDELTVFCELGDNVPDPEGGYGGIAVVERAGDTPITRPGSFDARTVPMELVLDAAAGGNVNDLYDNLEALAGRGLKHLPGRQRPKLLVDTAGLYRGDASNFPNDRFYLSGLTWSKDQDEQETDAAGNRIFAVAQIVLTLADDASSLQSRAVAARLAHTAANAPAHRIYRTVKGDTLISIARKKLRDAGRWPEIAAINPAERDPTGSYAAGVEILLP